MFGPALFAIALAMPDPEAGDALLAPVHAAPAVHPAQTGLHVTGGPDISARIVQVQQAETLEGILPEPAEGWTRALEPDAIELLEGHGGTGVVVTFSGPEGQRITVSVSVDTLDYQMYSGMFMGRGRMLHNFGVVHEVQGRNVLEFGAGDLGGDGHLVTLLPGRLCIKVEGGTLDERLELIGRIDFDAAVEGVAS